MDRWRSSRDVRLKYAKDYYRKRLSDPVKRKEMKAYEREYYEANKEAVIRRTKEWKQANPRSNLEYHWSKSGAKFTFEQYEKLLVLQDFRCAICRIHTSELKKRLAVDHDHDTGEVRGLLCSKCNMGLGQFQDSLLLLFEAAAYLSFSQELEEIPEKKGNS